MQIRFIIQKKPANYFAVGVLCFQHRCFIFSTNLQKICGYKLHLQAVQYFDLVFLSLRSSFSFIKQSENHFKYIKITLNSHRSFIFPHFHFQRPLLGVTKSGPKVVKHNTVVVTHEARSRTQNEKKIQCEKVMICSKLIRMSY